MRRHAQLIKLGLNTSPVFATRLINDYSRYSVLNSVSQAHQLFEEVPNKDTVLWTSLIAAYTHSNYPYNALQLFSVMLRQPESTHKPNHFVFATVARAIASFPEQIFLGQCIHAQVIKSGFLPGNIILETSFVDMYAKCHVVEYARKVFDEMPCRNLIDHIFISRFFKSLWSYYLMEIGHFFTLPKSVKEKFFILERLLIYRDFNVYYTNYLIIYLIIILNTRAY